VNAELYKIEGAKICRFFKNSDFSPVNENNISNSGEKMSSTEEKTIYHKKEIWNN
jgi:hypothetical protein